MLAHVSNESLQLFLIFLSKDFCTALYIYMQAITSLPLPTCQSGRTVHWESSPAPVLCTAMPDWWNPQCPQIRCCRKKHKDKRDRIHSEKPFSHSILKWFPCWPHFYLKRQKNKILHANKNEQRVSLSTTFHIPVMNFTTKYKSTEIQWKLK